MFQVLFALSSTWATLCVDLKARHCLHVMFEIHSEHIKVQQPFDTLVPFSYQTQKNLFLQHVSGSGEGQGLETTASPMMKQVVMSPLAR